MRSRTRVGRRVVASGGALALGLVLSAGQAGAAEDGRYLTRTDEFSFQRGDGAWVTCEIDSTHQAGGGAGANGVGSTTVDGTDPLCESALANVSATWTDPRSGQAQEGRARGAGSSVEATFQDVGDDFRTSHYVFFGCGGSSNRICGISPTYQLGPK